MFIRLSTLLLAVVILASCSGSGGDDSAKKRAYDKPGSTAGKVDPENQIFDPEQTARGEKLFNEKCVKCHKKYAQGEPYWQEKNDDGNLPPPPLDGTAHAWHHPTDVLQRFIRNGGEEYGGTMPPFKGELSDSQITDVIVWITALWPKDIYDKWYRRDQMTRGLQGNVPPPK